MSLKRILRSIRYTFVAPDSDSSRFFLYNDSIQHDFTINHFFDRLRFVNVTENSGYDISFYTGVQKGILISCNGIGEVAFRTSDSTDSQIGVHCLGKVHDSGSGETCGLNQKMPDVFGWNPNNFYDFATLVGSNLNIHGNRVRRLTIPRAYGCR